MHRIDTRGMSCPQPVLMAKKALDAGATELEVLVDNATADGNVKRFLINRGFKNIQSEPAGDDLLIRAVK